MLDLPIIRRSPRKAPYQKSEAVKELEQLATDAARLKHPPLPEYTLSPRKFRDDTANFLNNCIVPSITLKGGCILDQKHFKFKEAD